MQTHLRTRQATHFQEFQGRKLIVKDGDSGPFAYFQVSYTTVVHGDYGLSGLSLFRFI